MPSRKILVVLIVCLGVVGAIWILERPDADVAASTGASAGEIAETATSSATGNSTIDWQAILGTVQSTTTVASGLAGNGNIGTQGDTTETAQLAKDFMARYLLAQGQANQSGIDTTNGLDTDTSDQIVSSMLSSGAYITNQTIVYTAKNLNIQSDSSETTVKNYLQDMVKNAQMMQDNETQNGNEVDIINNAILNQDQSQIIKLDPIITGYQTLLSNMLKAPVPAEAVSLHLELTNNISAVLSDLQAVRQTFVDPVKALAALSTYQKDYTNMETASEKLEAYAQMKIKGFTN